MRKYVPGFAVWLLLIAIAVPRTQAKGESHAGMATLAATQGNTVKGTVRFTEKDGKTRVVANLTGLKPGKHGFHIHEKGDCSAPDAASAGGHHNPESKKHGSPDDAEHHVGDLGNIEADAKGKARLERTVSFLTLADGPKSINGKGVIVHQAEDDLKTQPTGNAGARVACGVIQRKK